MQGSESSAIQWEHQYTYSKGGQQFDIARELSIYIALWKQQKASMRYILKCKEKMFHRETIQKEIQLSIEPLLKIPREWYLCLQRTEEISLKQYMNKSSPLRRTDIAQIFDSLCNCVRFLHSKGVVHRCINIQNVQIDDTNKNCRLINFECAINLKDPERQLISFQNSNYILAPEISQLTENFKNTYFVDIFGLGTILYYLSTNYLLNSYQDIELIRLQQQKKQQESIIKSCLNLNWNQRITCQQLCKKSKRLAQSLRSFGPMSDSGSIKLKSSSHSSSLDLSYNRTILSPTQNTLNGLCDLSISSIKSRQSKKRIDKRQLFLNNIQKLIIIYQMFLVNYKLFYELKYQDLHQMMMTKYKLLIKFMNTQRNSIQIKLLQKLQIINQSFKKLKQIIKNYTSPSWIFNPFKFLCNLTQSACQCVQQIEREDILNSRILEQFKSLGKKLLLQGEHINYSVLVVVKVIQHYHNLTNLDQKFNQLSDFDKDDKNIIMHKLKLDKIKKEVLLTKIKERLKIINSKYHGVGQHQQRIYLRP